MSHPGRAPLHTRPSADAPDRRPLAVLVSGGLDSAILLWEALAGDSGPEDVFPLYVRTGLRWEPTELAHLHRFLAAVARPALRSLHILDEPAGDLYGTHWSITGEGVPAADTPDEAVFLPGRNVLLLAKSVLWCHLNGVDALALAPLSSNPFPDATPAFFDAFQDVLNRAVGGRVRILRPYAGIHKDEVMRRGREAPLGLTFSCLRPAAGGTVGKHCGRCNKCAERRAAFRDAGLPDPTEYDAEDASCTG